MQEWTRIIEAELGHTLDDAERAAFDWGCEQGRRFGSLGLARLDPSWPKEPTAHSAASYGVYLGDCARQGLPVDWELLHAEASNLARPAEAEWPSFDQLRPFRISDWNVWPWWLEFSTGDDGSAYYGWLGGDAKRDLTVLDAIEELGEGHALQVIDYSLQAVAAVVEIKEREGRVGAHSEETLGLVLSGLDKAALRLAAEVADARTAYGFQAPLGPRSRPSGLAL